VPYQSHPLDGWNGLPTSLLADVDAADLVMLASPNNPTGMAFAEAEIRRLIERGCHVLLDQTYVDFAGGASVEARYWLDVCERVLLFRSFSKGFGLAGLRIGCVLGDPDLIARLRSRRAYVSVDRLAVEAILGVLEEEPDFPIQLASRTAVQRRALITVLRSSGLFESVLDSVASFVLAICASEAATRKLRDQLRDEAGVLVASGDAFGVGRGLRFSVPDDAGLTRVEDALRTIRDGQRRIDDDELARHSRQPEWQPLL